MGNNKYNKYLDISRELSIIDNEIFNGEIMTDALEHIKELHSDADIRDLEKRYPTLEQKRATSFEHFIDIEEIVTDVLKHEREFLAELYMEYREGGYHDCLDDSKYVIVEKTYPCDIGYGIDNGEFRRYRTACVVVYFYKRHVYVKTAYPDESCVL